MRVFTIGTDHRKQFDFTRILWKFGIQVVFDVRRMPEAQEEHFRRDGLQSTCAAQGMDYIYLGNELGGPIREDLRSWISGDEFKRGLSIIRNKAAKRVCCILCAERLPEHCHRRHIAELLTKDGIEVVHILDENEVLNPRPAAPRPAAGGHDRNQSRASGRGPDPRRGPKS